MNSKVQPFIGPTGPQSSAFNANAKIAKIFLQIWKVLLGSIYFLVYTCSYKTKKISIELKHYDIDFTHIQILWNHIKV